MAITLLIIASPLSVAAEDLPRLLEVFLNERPLHVVVDAIQRDKTILIGVADLHSLGLDIDRIKTADTEKMVDLSAVPNVTWTVDELRQELHLFVKDDGLRTQKIGPGTEARTPAISSYGAVLNYNFFASDVNHNLGGVGSFEARAFSPYGVISTNWISGIGGGANPYVRLGTTYTWSDPDTLQQVQAGDVISGSVQWSRSARFGGLQIASNFNLRPDLITFPVPQLGGRADVPSTADLFVNGIKQLSQTVEPGPFQFQRPPVLTGADDVSVVVRDATGRETVQTLSFYSGSTLLATGLNSYSAEMGVLRHSFGFTGDSYGTLAGSGTFRIGVTDGLTAETHLEATRQIVMGGIGATVNIFGFAIGSGSVAFSDQLAKNLGTVQRGLPLQYSLSIERESRFFSFTASTTRATSSFKDILVPSGSAVPTNVTQLSVSLPPTDWGRVRAAFAQITSTSPSLVSAQVGSGATFQSRNRVLSASYTKQISSYIQIFANGYRDIGSSNSSGFTLGVVVPLGLRSSASVEGGYNSPKASSAMNVQQSSVEPGDIGWQIAVNRQQHSEQMGQLNYETTATALSGTIDKVGAQTGFRGEVTGALVVMLQGLFFTRHIDDSFAVIDTQGFSGVTVFDENRSVGQTDSDGLLLVPRLNSWENNRLSISPQELPANVETGDLHQEIRPRDRSGSVVTFGIKRSKSALIHFVDINGNPIALGSSIMRSSGLKDIIGYDGQAYLSALDAENDVEIVNRRNACHAYFMFSPQPDDIPDIGPVTCR